jgi:hypothetical protein
MLRLQMSNKGGVGAQYIALPRRHRWGATDGDFRLWEQVTSLLTPPKGVVSYRQQTRQASVLQDTLKLGGFLFSRGAA